MHLERTRSREDNWFGALYEEFIFCAHTGIVVWKIFTEDPADISTGRLKFLPQDDPDGVEMALSQVKHMHAALGFFITYFHNEVDTFISLHRLHSYANTPTKMCFVTTANIPDARVLPIESDVN